VSSASIEIVLSPALTAKNRRLTAAAHAATFLGDRFRGYDYPFPVRHRQRFVNTTGQDELHAYINPSHCDPALVDLVVGNGVPGALAVVMVDR
jgi:hypothetical protein